LITPSERVENQQAGATAFAPAPIIVVGVHRTGTKWLSNMLSRHSSIVSVQSESFGGILETDMFHRMSGKFDLNYPDDFIGAIELWSETEFFKLTGVSKEIFYQCDPRPRDFVEMLRILMEEFARSRGARFWLQKAHPIDLPRIQRVLGDAKLIGIRRGLREAVRSQIKSASDRNIRQNVLKTCLRQRFEDDNVRQLERLPNAKVVRYEDLRRDRELVLGELCDFLNVDFEVGMLDARYRPNSSFSGTGVSDELPEATERGIALCSKLVDRLPASLASALAPIMRRRVSGVPLVSGTFLSKRQRLADQRVYT
jgi:hypothetical protein